MVGTGRFELPTCRLGGGRSIHLSYVPAGVTNSSLPTFEPLLPDVAPELQAFKVDMTHGCIHAVDGSR